MSGYWQTTSPLDINTNDAADDTDAAANWPSRARYWTMAILNVSALSVGTTAGPIISRMYFKNGGSKIWFFAFLQTAGFPLAFPIIMYLFAKKPEKRHHLDLRLSLMSAVIGVIIGDDVYLYSWGLSYLPVSTSQLLIATQLGFTAIFAFLIVNQKFNAYSINAIVLLTLSSVTLAIDRTNDRPDGVSNGQYSLGFIFTLTAAATYGLIIPLVDLSYRMGKRDVTYTVVMEMQMVMSTLATLTLAAGMILSGEYQEIAAEAREFDGGVGLYAMCCVWAVVCWELYYIGIYGVTFQVNSLLSGIVIAACIPLTQLLAVVFFDESFGKEKGLSVIIAVWGVTSYLYGEYTRKPAAADRGSKRGSITMEKHKEAADKQTDPLRLLLAS